MLGVSLVECGLVSLRDLEAANGALVSHMLEGDLPEMSLLRVLVYELQTLREARVLDYAIEHRNVSGVSLPHYAIDYSQFGNVNPDELWETWTVPFDCVGGICFLATAYYMSPFVRSYWADKLQTEIVWYVAPLQELQAAIESFAAAAVPQRIAV